jgi:hypothetical protein
MYDVCVCVLWALLSTGVAERYGSVAGSRLSLLLRYEEERATV